MNGSLKILISNLRNILIIIIGNAMIFSMSRNIFLIIPSCFGSRSFISKSSISSSSCAFSTALYSSAEIDGNITRRNTASMLPIISLGFYIKIKKRDRGFYLLYFSVSLLIIRPNISYTLFDGSRVATFVSFISDRKTYIIIFNT